MKQRKRIAALLMAGVMLFSSLPADALGAEGQTKESLCEHHLAHTTECGYAEGAEGTPCNHEHTDECYTFVTNCVHKHGADCYPAEGVSENTATPSEPDKAEPTECPHECSEESGCIKKELDCKHEHDSACGYTPAAKGTSCAYVCRICNPQNGGELSEMKCSCKTLCTAEERNADCPVCSAEGADLTLCEGAETVTRSNAAKLSVEEMVFIDYKAEMVTFDSASYEVNSSSDFGAATALSSGGSLTELLENREGATLYVRGAGTSELAGTLELKRPDMDRLDDESETVYGSGNGKITDLAADKIYEYRAWNTASKVWGLWKPVAPQSAEITGLSPGRYEVRISATDTSFASASRDYEVDFGYFGLEADIAHFFFDSAEEEAQEVEIECTANDFENFELTQPTAEHYEISTLEDGGYYTYTFTIRPKGGQVVNEAITVRGKVDGQYEVSLTIYAQKSDCSWYEGHESDTEYTLTTAAELAGLSRLGVKMSGDAPFEDKTVRLGGDIDLSDYNWQPIVWEDGVFDGGGHAITGLNVTYGLKNEAYYGHCGGLFAYTGPGTTLQNFTVSGAVDIRTDMNGTVAAGGVVGWNECGTLVNIGSRVDVSMEVVTFTNGGVAVGGIAGVTMVDDSWGPPPCILNSYAIGSVSADTVSGSDTGGIAGVTIGDFILNCYYGGSGVTAESLFETALTAGIAVSEEDASVVSHCYSNVTGSEDIEGYFCVDGEPFSSAAELLSRLNDSDVRQELIAGHSAMPLLWYMADGGLPVHGAPQSILIQPTAESPKITVTTGEGEPDYQWEKQVKVSAAPAGTVTNDNTTPWTQSGSVWQSANQTDDSKSSLTVSYQAAEGQPLVFRWKVSCEEEWDSLRYTLTGPDGFEKEAEISGTEGDWETVTFFGLAAGTYTLTVTYEKDWSKSEGDDCGWVDLSQYSVPVWEAIPDQTASALIGVQGLKGETVRCVATYPWGETLISDSLTVDKGMQLSPSAPGLESRTSTSITLQTVTPNGNGAAAEYSRDDGATWQDSPLFTDLEPGTAYTFIARYQAEGDYVPSPASDKATIYTAAETPKTDAVTIYYETETITFADSLEVNAAENFEGAEIVSGGSIADYIGGTCYVRTAASNDSEGLIIPCSEAVGFTLDNRPDAPGSLQGTNETFADAKDGKITGTSSDMEYRLSSAVSWTPCTGESVTGLASGEYRVRYKATDSAFASADATVEIKTGQQRTYTLNVAAPIFDSVVYGYTQPEAGAITIKSTGNSDSAISGVTVDSEAFVIGGSGSAVTAGGAIDSWTIQPAAGLNAGSYTAAITVRYTGDGEAAAQVSFVVNQAGQAAPEKAPEQESRDRRSITLKAVPDNANGAKAEYSRDGGASWQTSPAFTGLSSGMAYSFVVRYGATEDGNFQASPASPAAEYSTESSGGGSSDNDSSGGTSSGSTDDSDNTSAEERPTEEKPDIPTTGETTPVQPDKNGSAAIHNGMVSSAINQAKQDTKKNGSSQNGIAIAVPVETKAEQAAVAVTIEKAALDTLIKERVQRFDIAADHMVSVSLYRELLEQLDKISGSSDIVLHMEKTAAASSEAKDAVGSRPVFKLTIHQLENGNLKEVTDLNGENMTVKIPYTLQKGEESGNLYAVYVDDNGNVQWITNSSYDPNQKALLFKAGPSGVYGVGCKKLSESFTDIENHWAKDDIVFAVNRGLLSGAGNNQFSPNTGITREMLATALGRLAGINPEDYTARKFTDVAADADYASYVNWAAEKGIVKGISAATFAPDAVVTREQMAVIMDGYAKSLGYVLPVSHKAVTFADDVQISSWAAESVRSMQQAAVLAGKDGSRFDPQGKATRAEAAAVLRRFVEIVIDRQTADEWTKNDNGSWMFYRDGKPVIGWLKDDDRWYWLETDSRMFEGGWKEIDGKWYYFNADGSMAVSTTVDGYEVGNDGAWKE